MKNVLVLILTAFIISCTPKKTETKFDPELWKPPYKLAEPEGWGIERFPIPIEFAPTIPYKGVEDLRFTPGWGDSTSAQYWSYSFLWFLDGKQDFTATIFGQHLKDYYSGLVGRNIEPRKIPKEKLFPIATSIQKIETYSNDIDTFSGTVNMLDYMTQKPMVLNCLIHVRSCPDKNNTYVFFEISPQPYSHPVWQEMNQIWQGFDCSSDQ